MISFEKHLLITAFDCDVSNMTKSWNKLVKNTLFAFFLNKQLPFTGVKYLSRISKKIAKNN